MILGFTVTFIFKQYMLSIRELLVIIEEVLTAHCRNSVGMCFHSQTPKLGTPRPVVAPSIQ